MSLSRLKMIREKLWTWEWLVCPAAIPPTTRPLGRQQYPGALKDCGVKRNLRHDIQIKICAEYWDMLPRPSLVCQEPGLRPLGRSPGVPDKSSRGLGSMSRYSAQILICFIAYIFLIFFIPLWIWLGTLQDCQYTQCPLLLFIVIRMRLVIRQSKLSACLAEVQLAHQNI